MDSSDRQVVGREEEVGVLAEFLDSRGDLPGVLLLVGEPGIGKTTLWGRAIELASERSYRVLSCRPSQAEAQLSFVALGDLLEPVLPSVLSALPGPQARALRVALLMEEAEGPAPNQHAIALAFLGALRALACDGPVTVAVDDIQWLDRSSAFVLEFALRRLRDEELAFLLALREEREPVPLELQRALAEERLRRVRVGPLSVGALHRLVSDRLDLVLPRPRLMRLREISGGNPLFALELGREVRRGAVRLEIGEPLPQSLAALVSDRLAALPADTRTALLAASAASDPTLELVGQVVGDQAADRLAPAVVAQVIEIERERVRFSHPLLASGIYDAAGGEERRMLHLRLAELLPEREERARHLALSAEGPDASVAAVLAEVAESAHARGALVVAAELSEQARRLTPAEDSEARHQRTIQSATSAWEAGDSERARALLEAARDGALPGPKRGEVLYWLGEMEEYEGSRRRAVELYQQASEEAGEDVGLRARIEEGLASCLFLTRIDLAAAAGHSRAAVALGEQAGDRLTQVAGLVDQAFVDAATGGSEWRTIVERSRELEKHVGPVPVAAGPGFCHATILGWVDELEESRTIFSALRDRVEERGEESALPWILAQLGWVEFLAGDCAEAGRCAEEGYERAVQAGQEPLRLFALGVLALVRATAGDVTAARDAAETTRAAAQDHGVMIAGILATTALGLLELSLDHHEAACAVLGPLRERLDEGGVREPGSVRFVPDEIEALIALGRLEEAEAVLDRLEGEAARLDRASALAAAGRCRGLLSAARGDLDAALGSLEGACAEHDRVSIPFERARTLLALGSTRRRAKMKRPAREALEQAVAIFEQLGATPWAEKARAELARVGGRAPGSGTLTPTEGRVAELVAEGRSNKEVAAVLFVTVKTVEKHLSSVYAKLGVGSRTELAHHLTAEPGAGKE
jgi:DNA-binding CsgD family transcriptional regulator